MDLSLVWPAALSVCRMSPGLSHIQKGELPAELGDRGLLAGTAFPCPGISAGAEPLVPRVARIFRRFMIRVQADISQRAVFSFTGFWFHLLFVHPNGTFLSIKVFYKKSQHCHIHSQHSFWDLVLQAFKLHQKPKTEIFLTRKLPCPTDD